MRDVVPVCKVHDRFQTQNGRWVSDNLSKHLEFVGLTHSDTIESPCDYCEGLGNLKLDFDELTK